MVHSMRTPNLLVNACTYHTKSSFQSKQRWQNIVFDRHFSYRFRNNNYLYNILIITIFSDYLGLCKISRNRAFLTRSPACVYSTMKTRGAYSLSKSKKLLEVALSTMSRMSSLLWSNSQLRWIELQDQWVDPCRSLVARLAHAWS